MESDRAAGNTRGAAFLFKIPSKNTKIALLKRMVRWYNNRRTGAVRFPHAERVDYIGSAGDAVLRLSNRPFDLPAGL